MKRYFLGVLGLTWFVLFSLAAVWGLNGCAGVVYDADKAYLASLEQYNAEVKRYEAYYQAATEENQAIYREEIDPLILQAGAALDAWGLARNIGNADAEMEGYLEAKNKMIDALVALYPD
jgi:hypothetical protein